MWLEGSCHCGGVKFRVRSRHPYPFNLCYCAICRKTAGGGGYAINLRGDSETLEVKGRENITVYRAKIKNPEDARARRSSGRRHFCKICGSALWLADPEWPEMMHPFASAIDTPLPKPRERTHLMLEFKAPWVKVDAGPRDKKHKRYPKESIAAWHERLGLVDDRDGTPPGRSRRVGSRHAD